MTRKRPPKRSTLRRRRTIPIGRTGMDWELPAEQPVPVITAERDDGSTFTVDHWQLASVVTLMALWTTNGELRLSARGWALAREDVQRGYEWGVSVRRPSPERITLHLHDTQQTEPSRVELIDLDLDDDGNVQAQHSTHTAPQVGLSGDTETDTHLAIMLTMLRENGGTLAARVDELLATANLIQTGHQWRVIELPFASEIKTFHLAEPADNGEHP